MTRVALIGAGKMGISHLAILGAHPAVQVVGVADTSKIVTDVLGKYSPFECFADYKKMLIIKQKYKGINVGFIKDKSFLIE